MKLSPQWIRDFVDLKVDNATLARDLTSIGMAVEGITGEGDARVFEMEIGTNRPDAMNHYGVAREASAFYDLPLKAIVPAASETDRARGHHHHHRGRTLLSALHGEGDSRCRH